MEHRQQILEAFLRRRAAIQSGSETLRTCLSEIHALIETGLRILHRYHPYSHISTFASTSPQDLDTFLSWAHNLEAERDCQQIIIRWNADSIAYVLKPIQAAIVGIETAVTALAHHEWESMPFSEQNHEASEDRSMTESVLNKQWELASTVVDADGELANSIKMLRDKCDRTAREMALVDKEAISRFRFAHADGRRVQITAIWNAMSDKDSLKPLEETWYREQAQRLRTLMALHFTDKIGVVTDRAEAAFRELKNSFD